MMTEKEGVMLYEDMSEEGKAAHREEYYRLQQEGMRAMSNEEMKRRQEESAAGAMNVGMEGMRGLQDARNNYYWDVVDSLQVATPGRITKKLTTFQRIAQWFKKTA